MDNPQPEEDDVLFASDPLDVVELVLASENLTFDLTEDGDLAFALAGDWKDDELWFAWSPEADCLQLCLSIDMGEAKSARAGAYEVLALVIQRVWLGHFEVWGEEAKSAFRAQTDKLAAELDLVRRDEFEALKAEVAQLRALLERLTADQS